jgi:hypothetical protein
MTLPIGNRTDAVGNGTTADYDYTFRILNEAHLLVTVRHPTTGVETTLTLTTDYTVDGVGDVGGGQISLVDSNQAWLDSNGYLDTGWTITQRGVEPLKQETDIRNQGDYYPEGIEDALDYQMRVSQQQQDEIDRSLKLPETVNPSDFDMTIPADVDENPGAVLIINPTGDGLVIGPTSDQISGAQASAVAAEAAQTAAESAQSAAEAAQAAAEAAAGSMTLASQAEAEAGVENTKFLSSLRTKQAIDAQVPILAPGGVGALTYALTLATGAVATNASLVMNGGVFTVTVNDNFTLSNPTNPVDGKKLIWRIKQDATGSRLLTLGNKFKVASNVESGTITLSTTAAHVDMIGAVYNAADDLWSIVAFARNITAVA